MQQTETMNETNRPERRPARSAGGPTRTCAGCGQHDDPAELVRVVLGPRVGEEAALLAVDMAGGSVGRGAHVHARPDCLSKAAKGGLSRSFKCRVDASASGLAMQIAEGCDRRIAGLLLGARRAQLVAVGADASSDALAKHEGRAVCLVVAGDAGSVVERGPLSFAVAEGRAVAWKDKARLGALFGRDEVAVCAITHESVADQLLRARRMADAVSGLISRSDACRSREVR